MRTRRLLKARTRRAIRIRKTKIEEKNQTCPKTKGWYSLMKTRMKKIR